MIVIRDPKTFCFNTDDESLKMKLNLSQKAMNLLQRIK